eukprot:54277-Eustigmatos_ZCMA.PRE.1
MEERVAVGEEVAHIVNQSMALLTALVAGNEGNRSQFLQIFMQQRSNLLPPPRSTSQMSMSSTSSPSSPALHQLGPGLVDTVVRVQDC